MRTKRKEKKSIFTRFILSYLLILLCCLLLLIPFFRAVVAGQYTLRMEEIQHRVTVSLENMRKTIETISELTYRLLDTMIMRKLLAMGPDLQAKDYFSLLEIQDRLTTAFIGFDIVKDVYLYATGSDVTLTMRRISVGDHQESFSKLVAENDDNLRFGSFLRAPTRSFDIIPVDFPTTSFSAGGREIAYCTSIKASSKLYQDCYILLTLDTDELMERFVTNQVYENGLIHVEDRTGALLFQGGRYAQDIEKLTTAPMIQKGDEAIGLSVSVWINNALFHQTLLPAYKTVLIAVFSLLVVGGGISVYLSYWQAKPMKRLVAKILGKDYMGGGSDEIGMIEQAIEALFHKSQCLQQTLEQERQKLNVTYFDRLLRNLCSAADDLEPKPFPFLLVPYTLVCLQFSTENNESFILYRTLIASLAEKLLYAQYVHISAENEIVIIFRNEEDREVCQESMLAFQNMILNRFQVYSLCGISMVHQGADVLSSAYTQCLVVLESMQGSPYLLCRHYQTLPDCLPEPLHAELTDALYTALITGNGAALSETVAAFLASNTEIYGHADAAIQLYYSLRVLLLAAVKTQSHSVGIPLPSFYNRKLSTLDNLSYLTSCMVTFCERVKGKQRSGNTALKENLIHYVEDHLSDVGLCAGSIASVFGISEKYVYLLVKEQTGLSLNAYIEEKRLSIAAIKLQKTQDTLQEIATAVGFASSNTFYKSFMRKYGHSPSAYRKAQGFSKL